MKSINASSFDSANTRIEKLKVSGFDVIITDAQGEQIRIIDGLPDILTGSLKLINLDGKEIETSEIVNSIDASKLGLDVAVLGSLLDGHDVESAGKATSDKTGESVVPNKTQDNTQAEKLVALQAENKQLKEQLTENEKQSANEKKVQLQVEKSEQRMNEVIVAPQPLEPIPSLSTNLPKKKLLDNDSGGSSSSSDRSPSAGNVQQVITVGTVGKVSKTVPLTVELNEKSDTGAMGDNITNVTQPLFSGTTVSSALVTMNIGDISYTTTADSNGNWSIGVTQDLTEGGNAYTVSATDGAGNSTTVNNVVVIDTAAQTITAMLQSQSDSGVKGDFITRDTKPILMGTAEADAVMTLVINGMTYTFNANSSGNWYFDLPSELVEGGNNYTVTATDIAGNSASYKGTLTIDTTAPSLTSTLDPSNIIYGDNVIGNSQPIFSGTAEPGATITLSIADAVYTLLVNQSGVWSFSVPIVLANKEWDYSISATDSAGNQTIIHNQLIIQNKDAAVQLLVTAGIDTSSDSGVVGDNITNNTRPILAGTAVANASIVLTLAGVTYTTTADSNGHWMIDFNSDFVNGVYDYSVTATTLDGTTGSYSGSFTVDTIAPSISVSLENQSDSGIIGDNITKVKQPVLTGLTEANATVVITISGTEYKTTANSGGEWNIPVTTVLNEGQNDYIVMVTDVAGNNSSATGSITLDTEIPPLTGIKFAGGLAGRYSNSYTPTIEGWGEAGATLTISIGRRSYDITIPESRKWFFYVPAGFIQAGNTTQYITFRETDTAGNSTLTTVKFHFITEKPDISADISAGSDTGIIGDKTTSDINPTLTGRVTSAALTPSQLSQSRVSVIIDGTTYSGIAVKSDGSWSFKLPINLSSGHSYNYTVIATDFVGNTNSYMSYITINTLSGNLDAVSITGENSTMETSDTSPTLSGTATAGSTLTIYMNNFSYNVAVTALGAWTFKVPDSLGNGKYNFTLVEKTTDGVTNTFTGYFIVDTRAPDVLTAELRDPESGNSNVANNPDVTLQGRTEALALVSILIGGITYQTYADTSGNWSYKFDSDTFAINSTINYKVTASDAAGNKTAINGNFIIDTITVSANLDIKSNSGDPHDNITNVKQPTFGGNTAANAEISLVINGKKYTTTADGTGKWSITLDTELADNTYHYTVTAASGDKVNYASGEVVVDTSTITSSFDLAASSDSGVVGDYLTNVVTPTLTGVTEAGATVILAINNHTYTTRADDSGSWSLTINDALPDSNNAFTITVNDVAGNQAVDSGHIVIDTLAPKVEDMKVANVGYSDITDTSIPVFSGRTDETDGKITISFAGDKEKYNVTVNSDDTWNYQHNEPFLPGRHEYTIEITDNAGNMSSTTGSFEVTSTVTALTQPEDTIFPVELAGVAEEHARVEVSIGKDLYHAQVDESGHWSLVTAPYPAGDYEYHIKVTTTVGDVSKDHGTITIGSDISVAPITVPAPPIAEPNHGKTAALSLPPVEDTFDGSAHNEHI